jgi:hypothetical protein
MNWSVDDLGAQLRWIQHDAGVSDAQMSVLLEGIFAMVRRWAEDEALDEGEAREVSERPPAVYYAPRGECEYCDRRRAAAARSMRAVREREG